MVRRSRNESAQENFADSVVMGFCTHVSVIIFSVLLVVARREPVQKQAPLWKYAVVCLSSCLAFSCLKDGCKSVSLPMKMCGLSFKMVPVMLWGMFLSGHSYRYVDWLAAMLVTGGAAEVALTTVDLKDSASVGSDTSQTFGLAMLGLGVAAAGFAAFYQEQIYLKHNATKANLMLYVSLTAGVVSCGGALLFWNCIEEVIAFAREHPGFGRDVVALSCVTAVGQWFAVSMVTEFGAVVFAAALNVQQVLAVVLSCRAHQQLTRPLQFIGIAVVAVGLLYKTDAAPDYVLPPPERKALARAKHARSNFGALPPKSRAASNFGTMSSSPNTTTV